MSECQLPAALFPILLPATVSCKLTGLVLSPTWETPVEFLAAGSALTVTGIWTVNQQMEDGVCVCVYVSMHVALPFE